MGPIVYRYSVKLGKDGKPIVIKFGNVHSFPLFLGEGLTVKEQREPLLEILLRDPRILPSWQSYPELIKRICS